MLRPGCFAVEGLIVMAYGNGTYRARLVNGYELKVYVPGRRKLTAPTWAPGDRVRLEISAYDLSEGRIIVD
ncbi:MAG: Translation initiation factor IF-1 [Verrucomicrobia bacterium ADurb.Bin118]|jgi:translation initiation factor IF-1|nr:MAG: Translation initiation factor IF-1 [Verrucomicrobia bacterium ADurb.Bin118]